jgi:hypothetical protein
MHTHFARRVTTIRPYARRGAAPPRRSRTLRPTPSPRAPTTPAHALAPPNCVASLSTHMARSDARPGAALPRGSGGSRSPAVLTLPHDARARSAPRFPSCRLPRSCTPHAVPRRSALRCPHCGHPAPLPSLRSVRLPQHRLHTAPHSGLARLRSSRDRESDRTRGTASRAGRRRRLRARRWRRGCW